MEANKINLRKETLEAFKDEMIIKHFNEGDIVLKEGAYIRSVPLIMSGSIKVFKSDNFGKEILLYYIMAGESCVMSFLGGLHNETSKIKAVVEEETEIWFLPIEKLTYIMSKSPEMMDYFFRLYHKRFEELVEMVNDLTFKKVDDRLLSLLEKKKEITNNNTIIITHEQLANELGTARVVVSRLLKDLENDGIVSFARNKIILN